MRPKSELSGSRHDRVDRAVAEWRSQNSDESSERLSAGTRARILAGATHDRGPARAPLASLFVPIHRLVAAGAVPALMLVMMLNWLVPPAGGPAEDSAAGSISAIKTGDEVVFVIANGNRPHRVYKSTSPIEFSGGPTYTTEDGTFTDALDSRANLVYYRID